MGRGVAASRLAPRESTGGDGWSGPRLATTGIDYRTGGMPPVVKAGAGFVRTKSVSALLMGKSRDVVV